MLIHQYAVLMDGQVFLYILSLKLELSNAVTIHTPLKIEFYFLNCNSKKLLTFFG